MGRMYAVAARAIQHRPEYAFNVAMNSARNKYYESIGGENFKAWHINEGMTNFYTDRHLGHYDENYWATVNLYRLPGTTVDTKERANLELASTNTVTIYSGQNWAGGVQLDDRYVAAGYQQATYDVTLKAKKSWFMLEGKIACLGADINSKDGRTIETIIDNRKQSETGNRKPTSEVINVKAGSGFYYNGLPGGYYFPDKADINVLVEQREGNWRDIGGSNLAGSNFFVTSWIDHGVSPKEAKFAYVFLPNANEAETTAYAASPDVVILENSKYAQAVKDNSAGVTGINFWAENRTVSGVTCNKQASFMMVDGDNGVKIAMSDPTWQNVGEIRFEIDRAVGSVLSKDEGVTVIQTEPKLILTITTDGPRSQGKTFAASFGKK